MENYPASDPEQEPMMPFRVFAEQHPGLCDEELGWFYQDVVNEYKAQHKQGERDESSE